MPIYEYRCDDCGHELEAFQKMVDNPLTDCPVCHQAALRRKISAPAFRLKGSGWYETDFKTGNQKNLVKDDSAPAETKTADKSKPAADSKPAAAKTSEAAAT